MLQSFASGFFPRMRLQKYTFFLIQQKENASGSKISQRQSLQYVFMSILILLFYVILSVFVSWCKRTFYLLPYIGAAQKGMLSVYCFFISPAVIRKSNWASLPSMELSKTYVRSTNHTASAILWRATISLIS